MPITKNDLEQLNIRLDKIEKIFKEVSKQYTSIQSSLSMIYDDRDLLTDVGDQISDVRGLILSADKHTETLSKDIKQTVESRTEEVMIIVEEQTNDIKKSLPNKVLDNIQSMFKKDKNKLKQKNIFQSFFSKINVFKLIKKKGGE